MSQEFFTGWEVRTLSNREPRYNPMSYHNGSVWPHDNELIGIPFMLSRRINISVKRKNGNTVSINPILPPSVSRLEVKGLKILGQHVDLLIFRKKNKIRTEIINNPELNLQLGG